MNRTVMHSILSALKNANQVLVVSHVQPDGDAVGSMAALAHMLNAWGKRVAHYNVSPMPKDFSSLNMGGPWLRSLEEVNALEGFSPDLYAVLDCGDVDRAGKELAPLLQKGPSLCIDHHLGNPGFGTVANWIDPKMAATAQMVGALAREAGFALSGPLGEAVYLGLNTDTGSFRFDSTTPEVMNMAADIIGNGLRLGDFSARYEKNWSLNRMQLWGFLMQRVELQLNGRVALLVVEQKDFDRFNADRADLEGFASFMQCLEGSEISLLVRENSPGRAKASLRSVAAVDVRAMAAEFGGGGHKNAAGAEFDLEPKAAAKALLDVAARHLALSMEKG